MIKKQLIETYLKKTIRHVLGEEWQISGESIIRRAGTIIQGIHFDRTGYLYGFHPGFANQILAIPIAFLYLTLGSRFRDTRGGYIYYDWKPDNQIQTQSLLRLIKEQTQPDINTPLTLEAIAGYLENSVRKKGPVHEMVYWSLSVVYGLLGRLDEAAKQLNHVSEKLKSGIQDWGKSNKPAPQWMLDDLKEVGKFQEKLIDSKNLHCLLRREYDENHGSVENTIVADSAWEIAAHCLTS